MVFVLCDFAEWDNDNDSIQQETNNNNEHEGNNLSQMISCSIMSIRTSTRWYYQSMKIYLVVRTSLMDSCGYGNYVDQESNHENGYRGANDDDTLHRGATCIFAPTIPQIKDIALINSPLSTTGTFMIDALLAPIGNKGQNMLFIGQQIQILV